METGRQTSEQTRQRVTLAAELYYVYHLTQAQIARQLNVSRVWVSKLLRKAQEAGIVKIEVDTGSAGVREAERALMQKYGVARAKVVRYAGEGGALDQCGRAAANFLAGILRPSDCVGVFWGNTLAAMAEQCVPLHFPDVTVTSLVGGIGQNADLVSNQISYKLADKLGAKSQPMHAPGMVASAQARDTLMQDAAIAQAVAASEETDVLVLGMGTLRNQTLVRSGCVSEDEFSELEALGAVGDIALHFVDETGAPVDHPVQQRVLCGDIMRTRSHAREVIGVASGVEKAAVLHAALAGEWLTTVVTDNRTANALLMI